MNYKTSYKHRGMFLESLINDSNYYYVNEDIALIYKKPTPIKVIDVKPQSIDKAVFERVSELDYCGVYKGRYIEFDAKECNSNTSFPLSNIKTHQLKHIENVLRHGGIAFLIIFINDKFYLFKGETLIEFISTNDRKSIPITYIEEYAIEIKEKYTPRLDYISIIDKEYFKESVYGKEKIKD